MTSFNFKKGDYVTIQCENGEKWLIIASGESENISNTNRNLKIFDLVHYSPDISYINVAIEDNLYYVFFNENAEIRLSTPKEIKILDDAMRENGYYFNNTTLKVEPIPQSISFSELVNKKVYKMYTKTNPKKKVLFIFYRMDKNKVISYCSWFENGDDLYHSYGEESTLIDATRVLYIQEATIEEAAFLYSKVAKEIEL